MQVIHSEVKQHLSNSACWYCFDPDVPLQDLDLDTMSSHPVVPVKAPLSPVLVNAVQLFQAREEDWSHVVGCDCLH